MKKIDLGQTLQILGNAGVIVGILLLVYELNQNRDMMRSQTRNNISETLVNMTMQAASNPSLAAVQNKAFGGETLTPLEARQWSLIQVAVWRYRENVSYQYRNGLYDESEYLAQREAWRRSLRSKAVRDFWCGREDSQSPQFIAEIDELLESPCN